MRRLALAEASSRDILLPNIVVILDIRNNIMIQCLILAKICVMCDVSV